MMIVETLKDTQNFEDALADKKKSIRNGGILTEKALNKAFASFLIK